MNWVLRSLIRLTARVSHAARREARSLVSWVVLIAVLETLSRFAINDAMDALAVTTFVSATWITVVMHLTQPLRWCVPLSNGLTALSRTLLELRFEFGIDMREQPALKRELPRQIPMLTAAAGLVFGAAALGHAGWPGALRSLIELSYVLYIVTLSILWATLLAGVLLCGGLLMSALHDAVLDARHRYRLGLGRGWLLRLRESSYGFSLFGGVLVASFVLPSVVAAGLIVTLWFLHALLLIFSGVHLPLLWKDADGVPRVMPWIWAGLALTTGGLFAIGAPVLMAIGDEFSLQSDVGGGAMPITRALGRLFVWSALFAFTTGIFHDTRNLYSWMAFRRAQRSPRELNIAGLSDKGQRRQLASQLAQHGWRVHFERGERREALTLRVEADAPAPLADFFGPSWPGVSSPEWLLSDEGLRKLERRWQVRQRRRLVRGLKSLFKRVSTRKFESGAGTWIAPHLWYWSGLTRDENEGAFENEEDYWLDRRLGPSFSEVFSWSTRVHFYEVMRELEIDLIFVEDGVRFRRMRRVLDAVFETYDIHGGQQRAEERHFAGLTGLSVVIVEIGLDDQLNTAGYPEPDYDEVGRARILHVFRDRGGEKEDETVPEDVNWTPISEWGPLLPTA